MEQGQRKSSRPVKIRQDPDFVYEQESVQFLNVSARDRSENFLSEATHEPSWLGVNFFSGTSNTVSVASVPIEASQAYSVSNTTFENLASNVVGRHSGHLTIFQNFCNQNVAVRTS